MRIQSPYARRTINVVSPLLNATDDPYASERLWRDKLKESVMAGTDLDPTDTLIDPDLGPQGEDGLDEDPDEEFIDGEGLVIDEFGNWVFPEDA